MLKPTTAALALAAMFTFAQVAYPQVSYPPSSGVDMPPTCGAPAADTFAGTAGTGSTCVPRSDAARPTQVQPTRTTSLSDGSWTATWPTAFGSTPTYGHAEILGGNQAYSCDVLTLSTTTATGKCYALVPTTLPTTLTAVVGLVVSPISNPGAGLTVMVVGRQ